MWSSTRECALYAENGATGRVFGIYLRILCGLLVFMTLPIHKVNCSTPTVSRYSHSIPSFILTQHDNFEMRLRTEERTDEDMPRAFEPLSYVESVFPTDGTPEGRRLGAERLLQWRKSDPLAANVKAVDEARGKMIGHANWIIPKGVIPPEFELSGDHWETEEEKEYAAWMCSQ